jgi:hypothetical protein
MVKSSKKSGKSVARVEVTHISSNGVWLLADKNELFMAFDDFPWFKEAAVGKILNVEEPHPGHFYWPDLDVDLTLDIIEHPEKFPLKMR